MRDACEILVLQLEMCSEDLAGNVKGCMSIPIM